MDDHTVDALLKYGAIGINVLVLYIMNKVKLDISDLKIWVMENFERRKNVR